MASNPLLSAAAIAEARIEVCQLSSVYLVALKAIGGYHEIVHATNSREENSELTCGPLTINQLTAGVCAADRISGDCVGKVL